MKNKSLLTEAIVSALLFAICALVAVSLLLSAYVTSRKSGEMIEAIEIGRSFVESAKAGDALSYPSDGFRRILVDLNSSDDIDGYVEVYNSAGELLLTLPCSTAREVQP